MKQDMKISDCLLIFGLCFTGIYFFLVLSLDLPSINLAQTYPEDYKSSVTPNGTIYIWTMLLLIASIALFIGFLLKIPNLVKKPHQQWNFLVCIGFIFTIFNMYFQFYSGYASITGEYEWKFGLIISIFWPIVLLFAVFSSITYPLLHRQIQPKSPFKFTNFYISK